MLQIKNIRKKYDNNIILDNITVDIDKGNIVGVVGANGAGKTTLLSIIATVMEEYDGELVYDNYLVKKSLKKTRKNIGYVPQQATLFEELTVNDNIKFWSLQQDKEYIDRLIYIFELEGNLNKRVKNLSGGTKNRVNILIGILNKPNLIILDEPLVGVSLSIKRKFFKLIKEFSEEGKIVLISSHELWELEVICSHILVIKDCKLQSFRTMEESMRICDENNIKFWDYICNEGGL